MMNRICTKTKPGAGCLAISMMLASALVTAATAGAQGPPPPDGHRGRPPRPHGPPPIERVLERHAERLGLSDEVAAEIRRLSETERQQGEVLRRRLRVLHDEMRALLSADAPDEARVMEQAERIGLAEIEARKHRLSGMLRVRGLLTKEQRAELVEIHAEERPRSRPRDRPPHADRSSSGPPNADSIRPPSLE